MPSSVRINPKARAFLGSLSQDERDRLFRCWRILQADPDVDGISTFNFPIPPLVFRLHHCDRFDTLYGVDHHTEEIVIFAVVRAGERQTLRP